MSKLLISEKEKFQQYKGFVYVIEPVDDTLTSFVGMAESIPEPGREQVKLSSQGKTRREAGDQLLKYIDTYRASAKPPKMIITTGN